MTTERSHETESNAGLLFLTGAALGALAVLLSTPQTGRATRAALSEYARRTESDVLTQARAAREELARTLAEAKRFVRQAEVTIAAAVEAGKEAFKSEPMDRR